MSKVNIPWNRHETVRTINARTTSLIRNLLMLEYPTAATNYEALSNDCKLHIKKLTELITVDDETDVTLLEIANNSVPSAFRLACKKYMEYFDDGNTRRDDYARIEKQLPNKSPRTFEQLMKLNVGKHFMEAHAARLGDPVKWGTWKDARTIVITASNVEIRQRDTARKGIIIKGSQIRNIHTHSGMNPVTKKERTEIRDISQLEHAFPQTKPVVNSETGREQPSEWVHAYGQGKVMYKNKEVDVQVHFYEHPSIGACGIDTKDDLEMLIRK